MRTDLIKHEQCLIDLHQTFQRLQIQQQEVLNRLMQYYLDRLADGQSYSSFIPFVHSDKADSICIAYYAMYYSINQFPQAVLALGGIIHTIFELETTNIYRRF